MLNRRKFLKEISAGSLFVSLQPWQLLSKNTKKRPNVLWLSCEDISPHLGCYGDPHAITRNLDKLAAQGILNKNAFIVSPVCAPNRSCIITGVYPTTLGTHHPRSGGEGIERSIKSTIPLHLKCFQYVDSNITYFIRDKNEKLYTKKFSHNNRSGNNRSFIIQMLSNDEKGHR